MSTEVRLLTFKDFVPQPRGLYAVGYSFLFGAGVWVTFFGGVIAYKALPRHQFGALQHRIFPVYFSISLATSAALLGYWSYSHPDVPKNLLNPSVADTFQAWTLATVATSHALNYFVIGPVTSKTMFERHKLEKEEGKQYNDPGVSDKMKAMNKRFAMLHGYSSLANLTSMIALTFHGLWIGSNGV